MHNLLSDWIFFEGVLFCYFFLKSFLFYHRFKVFSSKDNLFVSFLVGSGAFLLNRLLVENYKKVLFQTPVKGAIEIPHFIFLFILADIISTFLLVVLPAFRKGVKMSREVFEIGRLIMVFVIFGMLTNYYWMRSYEKIFFDPEQNYQCFKHRLLYDLAYFKLHNTYFPEGLSDFTQETINPLNNSFLIYTINENGRVFVKDTEGNDIINSSRDLIGIKTGLTNPDSYLNIIKTGLESYCR